jgi:hypothetical protein
MDRDIDSRAGYKHHLTKEYLQEEVMKLCKRESLHQVDLLSPAGTKITEKEYRAKENGQRKLDKLNKEIILLLIISRVVSSSSTALSCTSFS